MQEIKRYHVRPLSLFKKKLEIFQMRNLFLTTALFIGISFLQAICAVMMGFALGFTHEEPC